MADYILGVSWPEVEAAVLAHKNSNGDYIKEAGTSGIWRYVKLNSGLCFCFGRVTQSLVLNTASGSNYVNANTLGKEAFPFQFSSILCYTVDCDNSMGAWVVKSGYATLTNAGGYKIMRTTAATDARDYHVSYFVIGTISTS